VLQLYCIVHCVLQFVAVFTVLQCQILCVPVPAVTSSAYCNADRVAVVLNECWNCIAKFIVLQFIAVFNVFLMYGSVNCVLLLYRFVHRVVRCSQCVVVNVTLKHNCSTLQ